MIDFFSVISRNGIIPNSATMRQLRRRIERAHQMSSEGYSLWGQLTSDTAIGVIQSQSEANKYYYTFIRADGTYGCFDNNLQSCLGQPLYFPPQRRRRRNRRDFEEDDFDEDNFYIFNLDNDDEEPEFFPQARNNNRAYGPRWEYAKPCKHVYSLLNGFCTRGDIKIENLLEDWINRSYQNFTKPIRDSSYGIFIQTQFHEVRDQVLERSVFKPIPDNPASSYSFYKPSKQVKILDLEDDKKSEPMLELHIAINGNEIESLPLKNIICISCLQREPDESKLKHWVKCIECQSQYCEACYSSIQQDMTTGSCLSAFSGYKKHKLEVVGFNDKIVKPQPVKKQAKELTTKKVIFEFGDK